MDCYRFFHSENCPCYGSENNANFTAWNHIPDFDVLDKKTDRWLGIEIEMYNFRNMMSYDSMADVINRKFYEIGLPKWDGSIRDRNGIEFVSHVTSYPFILKNPDAWIALFAKMKEKGYVSASENTCSGHIHYSDTELTNDQLVNIIKYFSNNPWLLRVLSRRQMESNFSILFLNKEAGVSLNNPRNSWLNFSNPATVEFRFLAGISSFKHLKQNIETALAIIDFGRIDIPDVTPAQFFKFVDENVDEYPTLKEYIDNVRDNI